MNEEKITLTKDDLERIIKQAIKENSSSNVIQPSMIFNEVAIRSEDFQKINKNYEVTKNLKTFPINAETPVFPVTLKKYRHGYEYINNKANLTHVHDFLRKLTLTVFGVTLNFDLKQNERIEAAKVYQEFKELYLKKYDSRIRQLNSEDIDSVFREEAIQWEAKRKQIFM